MKNEYIYLKWIDRSEDFTYLKNKTSLQLVSSNSEINCFLIDVPKGSDLELLKTLAIRAFERGMEYMISESGFEMRKIRDQCVTSLQEGYVDQYLPKYKLLEEVLIKD